MDLFFNTKLADKYTSLSQKIRVLTEDWVDKQAYCPNCGHLDIDRYENNRPIADFFCANCQEDYELKSKKDFVGIKIVDGAYRTMIERLESANNPNFFLLNYDIRDFSVLNFFVIPKHFFVSDIIEKRKVFRKPEKYFSLDEVYAFENILSNRHPDNKHIKDKIRQQLQMLRDKGYLEFTERGRYRLM